MEEENEHTKPPLEGKELIFGPRNEDLPLGSSFLHRLPFSSSCLRNGRIGGKSWIIIRTLKTIEESTGCCSCTTPTNAWTRERNCQPFTNTIQLLYRRSTRRSDPLLLYGHILVITSLLYLPSNQPATIDLIFEARLSSISSPVEPLPRLRHFVKINITSLSGLSAADESTHFHSFLACAVPPPVPLPIIVQSSLKLNSFVSGDDADDDDGCIISISIKFNFGPPFGHRKCAIDRQSHK